MIILAHDGSLYGDWIARYALNFAAKEPDRKLLALHVVDDDSRQDMVAAKFAHLEKICTLEGIDFTWWRGLEFR